MRDTIHDVDYDSETNGRRDLPEHNVAGVRKAVHGAMEGDRGNPDLGKTLEDIPTVADGAGDSAEGSGANEFQENPTVRGGRALDKSSEQPIDIYCREYNLLPEAIRARTTDTWEDICKRLTSEKLQHIQDMQGHGQLFGIDVNGRVLFKDRGTHPVMFGFDENGRLLRIYDRDKNSKQMNRVQRWMNGAEIVRYVENQGYELFRDNGKRTSPDMNTYGFGDEMRQAEAHTKKPFIACQVHSLMALVRSGSDPNALHVVFNYKNGRVDIRGIDSIANGDKIGVIRMTRV